MEMEMESEQRPVSEKMSCRSPTCPPWLQAAIADIEQRVRSLAVDESPPPEHSFAERAENYYHKRPQLLSLLTDLHRRYLSLAQRYAQTLSTLHHKHPSSPSPASHHAAAVSDCGSSTSDIDDDPCSDADSSLSYQHPPAAVVSNASADLVVAELVAAWVDGDVLADEASRRAAESSRKIELQGSLVEVLESERLVLLGENARLGFRASSAEDEAAAVAAELGFARRRAAEMARLVVRLREDHRACAVGRKAEALLRKQVYALEVRNRQCFEAMAAWEAERRVVGAEIQRLRAENRRLEDEVAAERVAAAARRGRRRKKGSGSGGGWWAKVRMAAEWTPCAPPVATVTVRKVVGGEQVVVKGKDGDGGKYYYGGGCFCV